MPFFDPIALFVIYGIVGLYLVIVLLALIVSAIYAYRSRRANAWTPVVLVLTLTPVLLTRQHWDYAALAVIAIGAWLFISWPGSGQSDVTPKGRKRWHPRRALVASVGTFLVLALAAGWVFWSMFGSALR